MRPVPRRLLRLAVVLMAALGSSLSSRPVAMTAAGAQPAAGLGSLRGRVEIRRAAAAMSPRPGVADLGSSMTMDTPELPRAVVFLESPDVPETSVLRGQPLAPVGRARMDQRNETFAPHVLAVDVGTVVDFPNNDQTFHNVFSLSKTKRFDLGRYGRGKSKPVRFDRPGVVRVFCDIHSHMNAFIVVFNHPFHATTDDDSRYRIDNIPPGTYNVTAWHEGSARDSHSVTIPAGSSVVSLDFLVQ